MSTHKENARSLNDKKMSRPVTVPSFGSNTVVKLSNWEVFFSKKIPFYELLAVSMISLMGSYVLSGTSVCYFLYKYSAMFNNMDIPTISVFMIMYSLIAYYVFYLVGVTTIFLGICIGGAFTNKTLIIYGLNKFIEHCYNNKIIRRDYYKLISFITKCKTIQTNIVNNPQYSYATRICDVLIDKFIGFVTMTYNILESCVENTKAEFIFGFFRMTIIKINDLNQLLNSGIDMAAIIPSLLGLVGGGNKSDDESQNENPSEESNDFDMSGMLNMFGMIQGLSMPTMNDNDSENNSQKKTKGKKKRKNALAVRSSVVLPSNDIVSNLDNITNEDEECLNSCFVKEVFNEDTEIPIENSSSDKIY